MSNEEALWIANLISKDEDNFFPLLNLGSSTKDFRANIQPWIDEIIFNPLRNKGRQVFHSDLKKENGVDLVGNIFEKEFAEQLKNMNFKSIICSNVLEHIIDVSSFCYAIESIASSGTYIFMTAPNLYPYHKDPIDTKFRPDVSDITNLFPQCQLINGVINIEKECHFSSLIKNPYSCLLTIKNWLIPRYGIKDWKMGYSDIPNLFKNYRGTWVLLRKT